MRESDVTFKHLLKKKRCSFLEPVRLQIQIMYVAVRRVKTHLICTVFIVILVIFISTPIRCTYCRFQKRLCVFCICVKIKGIVGKLFGHSFSSSVDLHLQKKMNSNNMWCENEFHTFIGFQLIFFASTCVCKDTTHSSLCACSEWVSDASEACKRCCHMLRRRSCMQLLSGCARPVHLSQSSF